MKKFFAIVQADSHEEAANLLAGHPHLKIPEATIELMSIIEMGK